MKARQRRAMPRPPEAARLRAKLAARLRERNEEIEEAVLTRVYAIADPSEAADPAYADGLRVATATAIEYGLQTVERGDNPPPVPVALLAQARLAARNRVSLDTVLRRYVAGYSLLGDFLVEEAAREESVSGTDLKRLLAAQATVLDHLFVSVSEEYALEGERSFLTAESRRVSLVERLLAGEPLDPSPLGYEFDACHVAVVATGADAAEALRALPGSLDCRQLVLSREEEAVWAWLGTERALDSTALRERLAEFLPPGLAAAVGEAAQGLAGWRLSHRQAAAALPIALRGPEPLVRYADVALLASAVQDDVLVHSLHQLYLAPLESQRDRGAAARETLRAYLTAGCNTTSAAAILGINRNTVSYRLRTIEDSLGRPLASCVPELQTAIQIQDYRTPDDALFSGASPISLSDR